jgi:flagellar motility protein MotE (MotC chaperone)
MRQGRWHIEGLATAIALAVAVLPVSVAAQGTGTAVKEQPRAAPKAGLRTQAAPRAVPLVPPEAKPADLHDASRSAPIAEQYCSSVLDSAREARFAYQAAELKALNAQLDARAAKLDERIAELKEWVARREDFASRTSDQLVTIYSGMRPEAASEQLAKLEESSAAAILSKLAPRVASQILNDMPSEKAARLAMILMGASKKTDPGGRS